MISVIIPVFNGAHTLQTCVDSIVKQTLTDYEVIIVNDGSTDDTHSVLADVQKKHSCVRIIEQTNKGANAARNAGGRMAKGEYVFFCDADSVLAPNALQKLLYALEKNPAASYAYSSFTFGWKTFTLFPFDADKLRRMPYIHTSSLIRRECFPGFDESLKRFQDWDLYLTMLEHGHRGVWIPEVLFRIVNVKGTMSRWVPSCVYKISWLPIVKRYRMSEAIIRRKHHLD